MDSFEWNKIFGGILAGLVAVLGVSIISDMMFTRHLPEKPGYEVAGAEEAPAAGAAAAEAEKPAAFYLASADVAKGEAVFKKCAACHTIAQGGANGIGPNLWASMGKPHGHVAGFAYSDALKSVPGNWDWEGMDKWLANPKKYAPGTKMTFAGLGNPEARANLILYLNAQGSNLPLPTPPAAEAPAADAAAADAATGEAGAAPATDAAAAAAAPAAAK